MTTLVSAIEVGSVRALTPVCIELVRNEQSILIERKGYFCEQAVDELTTSLVDFPLSERNLAEFIEENEVGTVLFSVNVHDSRPLTVARVAQSLGVETVHLLDYWNCYRARMELDGQAMFQPTRYLVPDEYAKQKAVAEEIPADLIRVVGQPTFADLKVSYQTAYQQKNPLTELADNEDNVFMFVSEPVAHDQGNSLKENASYRGYTERDVLQILVNALKAADEKISVVVVPHPRQDADEVEELWRSCDGEPHGIVQKEGRGRDLLPFVKGVLGMASTLVYEAWLVGKPVLSIQPGLLNNSLRMMQDKNGVVFIDCYESAVEQTTDWLSTSKTENATFRPDLERHQKATSNIMKQMNCSLL